MAQIIIASIFVLAIFIVVYRTMRKEEKRIRKEIASTVPYDPTSEDSRHHFRATEIALRENKVMISTREDGIYVRLAGNVNEGEAFRYEWGKVIDFEKNKSMK